MVVWGAFTLGFCVGCVFFTLVFIRGEEEC